MKFSIWPHLSGRFTDLVDICLKAEASGWDGIWVADHFMPNTGDQTTTSGPTSEAWTTLSAIAALVPRVRIGTLVTGNTYRNPAVLAKMAAEVDVISNGRLVLGLGAGWQENEHLSYGIEFATVGGRLARLRESIQIIRSLLDKEYTNFSGKYYEITNAPLSPKPVQSRLPILVGGGGEKVTLKITALFADEWNVWGSPEVLKQKGHILDQHCEAIDRDPGEIRRSAQALFFLSKDTAAVKRAKENATDRLIAGTPDEIVEVIGQYANAGVNELIVPNFNMGDTDKVNETYDFWMHDVLSQLS